MALTTLNIKETKPKNLKNDNEDDFEIELMEESEDSFEDFEDDFEEEDVDDSEMDSEEEVVEEDNFEDEDEDDFEDDDEDEEEASAKPNSRENDRIRSLVEARKVTETRLAQEKEKRKELEKRMIALQKTSQETSINLLKNNLTAVKKQMIKAQEEGNAETIIDLQEQLSKTQMDLAALESWEVPKLSEDEEDDVKQPIPYDAQLWLGKNKWFQNPVTPRDKKRQKEAIKYSEMLIEEGYSYETPEFYEMVDNRLEKLGLANAKKNKVKSTKSSSDKTEGRKTQKKKISQTVQGASRTPASKSSSRKKITLTPEQQKIARLYDMTYAEYAAELMKIEASAKGGKRMTTLNI